MILIVDDQKENGEALERLLKYAGHESVAVTGGAEAIAMLHVRKPALLVLDVNMPGMDGLSVVRTMREHDELKDIKVAMYSTDSRADVMAQSKRLGAIAFLSKGSMEFDELVNRICELAGEPV